MRIFPILLFYHSPNFHRTFLQLKSNNEHLGHVFDCSTNFLRICFHLCSNNFRFLPFCRSSIILDIYLPFDICKHHFHDKDLCPNLPYTNLLLSFKRIPFLISSHSTSIRHKFLHQVLGKTSFQVSFCCSYRK